MVFTAISWRPRCAKSFHNAVLMLPSGFIAKEPPLAVLAWPVSVLAETAPSTIAVVAGGPAVPPDVPASAVKEVCTPPAQPPPPLA